MMLPSRVVTRRCATRRSFIRWRSGDEVLVRSHRGRAGRHHVGGRGLLGGADPACSQYPDHDALLGDDHAAIPSLCERLLRRHPGGAAWRAGGYITPQGVEESGIGAHHLGGTQVGVLAIGRIVSPLQREL
jgi:hypothetical protein